MTVLESVDGSVDVLSGITSILKKLNTLGSYDDGGGGGSGGSGGG